MAASLVLKRTVSPSFLARQGRWQARLKPHHILRQLQHNSQSSDIKKYNASSAILRSMPAEAWDCHMHVTSPDYPLAENAAYKPALHDIGHAMTFEKTVGIPNVVLVQPSIYGNDNSCLLDALKAIGPHHGRGVVGIDPDAPVDSGMLKEWHELGVRGVRLNLKSTNVNFTEQSLQGMLEKYARIVKPLGWILELFIGMEDILVLEKVSGTLGVKLCIAHFGAPRLPPMHVRAQPFDPYDMHGFRALVSMLGRGDVWVKFSAAYRFDGDAEMRGIEAIARELLARAGDRVVFATDWPHTRFDGLDVRPFVERYLQWTDEAGLTEKVFTLNARELWDVGDQ